MHRKSQKITILHSAVFLMVSLIFIFGSTIYLAINQAKTIKREKSIQVTNETYLLEREDRGDFFRIEVKYPQIMDIKSLNISKKINIILQNTAFSLYGQNTYKDAILYLEDSYKDTNCYHGDYIDYNILCLTDNCISLIFAADAFSGSGSIYFTQYLSTINLKTGQYISLNDLVDTKQLIKTIQNKKFEIYEGSYNEFGDPYDSDRIQQIIDTIEQSIEDTPPSIIYNRYSCQNIGLDKEYLYTYFNFSNSLNGYVILRVPLEQLILK